MWDLTFFVWSTMVKLTIILIWRNERRASEHLFCIFQNLIRIEVIEEVNMWLEWRMLYMTKAAVCCCSILNIAWSDGSVFVSGEWWNSAGQSNRWSFVCNTNIHLSATLAAADHNRNQNAATTLEIGGYCACNSKCFDRSQQNPEFI